MDKRYAPNIRATGLALAASFVGPAAFAKPPEAGTIIEGGGTVTYLNNRLGISETLTSNTVLTEVLGVDSFIVSADQQLLRTPGDNALFTFDVSNTGNTDIDVLLNFGDITGDFDFARANAWIDTNRNGRVDAEDVRLDPDVPIALGVEDSVGILVDARMPDTARAGQSASGELSGVLLNGSLSQIAIAEVLIVEEAASLQKSADVTEAAPGGEIIYTLSLRNNSDIPIVPDEVFDGLPLNVDGVGTELLIVRDDIPVNTNFQRIIDAVNFDPVFHRHGDPETDWTATQPEDVSEIDGVAFVSDDPLPAGESRDFQFAVTINPDTSGVVIENTGEFLQPDGAGNNLPVLSNNVLTPITGAPGVVSFYSDPEYTDEIDQTVFDELVYLEVNSGLCNVSSAIDQAVITVTTNPDGDIERVIAIETAPNSGVFRAEGLPVAAAPPVLIGDGVLQGSRRGAASAIIDCDPGLRAEIDLSPAGAVFLSATNAPVPNALVELLDANGNVIGETTTDAEGLYDIVPEIAGVHRIRVTPPEGLVAPSQRESFPGFARNVLADASFGQPFVIGNINGALTVDVPVDHDLTGALAVAKTGDRTRATIGEIVSYTIEVRNNAPIAIAASEITDTLPTGLGFLEGSARLNGQAFAEPTPQGSRALVFDLGLLEPNSTNTLTYAAQILPTAGEGDKINTAFAAGVLVGFDTPIVSNTAGFTVTVDNRDGVFSRDGVVLGKVFLDCDANGLQDAGEPGIPGVQIHTEEGLTVVTDGGGLYSLGGLSPRTHILNVYEQTLPEGTDIAATRVFDAGAGGSRFVPVHAGEIRTEDFAVTGCADNVLEDIHARIKAFEDQSGEQVSSSSLQFESGQQGLNVQSSKTVSPGVSVEQAKAVAKETRGPAPIKAVKATTSLDEIFANAPGEFAFADLEDGDVVIQRNISIRTTAPSGAEISLQHNGVEISADKIGQRGTQDGVQAIEYVAVSLVPGVNTLTLIARDSFGNVRGEKAINITAPGDPVRVELIAPETAIADPSIPVPFILQAVDSDGNPASAPIEATLSAREDSFDVRDKSEQIPGIQTLLNDGRAELSLIPASIVGTRTISVETQFGRTEARIRFTPNIDGPQIAVGFGEAAYGFNTGNNGVLTDVFDRDELSPFEETEEGVEAAFFLKGRLFNDTLLTLRHDSAKNTEDGLFRSVEPDEFYPVYGDQSQRGFEARSRGKTFGKIERGSSYVVFGDVAFDAAASALQLGAFQRSLEGAKVHAEAGRFSFDAYAGRTDTGQTVLEIPAQGISGPYDLGIAEVIENSEVVELITRDRNQPGVILRTERLGRFSAYTIDYFAQTLVFNRPIASRDSDLNPVSIRVTFETEEGDGEDYWLFGGEAAFSFTDWLDVGFRQLTSDGPEGSDDDRTVRAAYISAAVGKNGALEIEAAQSIDPLDKSGTAVRVNYEQQFERGSFGARLATTTNDFDAPGASVSAGRDEARIYGTLKAGPGTLTTEALYTADNTNDAERIGAVARYEANLTGNLRARVGGRYVTDTPSSGDREDALTVIAGLGWSPKFLGGANIDIEAEQEVTDGSQSRVSLGADYAVNSKLRLYTQAEYSGSRSGSFGLTDNFNDDVTVRVGGEYRWTDRVTAFSEYRANESIFDSGVANGLTASWSVSPSLNLRLRGEHVQPIGEDFQRNTAIAVGATWEPESSRYILDGDVEFAAGQGGQRTWFASSSAGYRWKEVTFLGRNRLARTSNVASNEVRLRDRARVGAAWRPTENDKLNVLTWYEYELDEQSAIDERRHIWSLGGEYKPNAKVRLRARTAGQVFTSQNELFDQKNTTLLFQGGVDWDALKRLNLALNGAVIGDNSFTDTTFGVGAEANVQVAKNLLLGVGYNYSGLEEQRVERLFRSGVFVRLRLKFDENIWNIFDRDP